MIRAIRELESLKGRKSIPREDRARARKNIETLYILGFKPEEITVFANWITAETVKKYCRGLEVKGLTQKEHAMDLLSQFADANGNWEELEYYIESKNKIEATQTSLDDLLNLITSIDNHEVSLNDVNLITAKLDENNMTWGLFIDQLSSFLKVVDLGWTIENLETLREKTTRIGFKPLMETIASTLTREEMKVNIDEFNKEIEERVAEAKRVETEIERLDIQYAARLTHIRYAETLQDTYKIDLNALGILLETAEKGGDPIYVLDQLNKYLRTQDLDVILKGQKEKLETLFREILGKTFSRDDLDKELYVLNQKIGAIEELHSRSRKLQNIANLLDNPAGTDLTPENFNILTLTLLTAIRDYAYTHQGLNTQYDKFVKNHVDNAVNILLNIVSGKLA